MACELSLLAQRFRLLHRARRSPLTRQLALEACRRDPGFWFDYFCWTFDPRRTPSRLPFQLYPFQRELLSALCAAIDKGDDLLIEKSRDMGVSWITLLAFQYYWLFREGSHFLIGSRKADLVDSRGDLSTLLQKCRFNFSMLPSWMRPAGFKDGTHNGVMRLVNPKNGNTLIGESSNPHFGRGGRYKAVLMDEFPFWPYDDKAFAAAGQSTPSRILVGTPYGKLNRFARLRLESGIAVKTLHWRLHPLRNETWYLRQQGRMSPEEVARELDICYERSASDRVFRGFDQRHVRDVLLPVPGKRILRSWDFGYRCPACVFTQLDDHDRLRVLHEVVGQDELLLDFIARVREEGRQRFPDADYEDVCDPAGVQRSDKSACTSVEILQSQGVFPFFHPSDVAGGIERIRTQLAETIDGQPALMIARRCRKLIAAMEGGYRFRSPERDDPAQEHPHEDVVDCLRYAVSYKCRLRPSEDEARRRRHRVRLPDRRPRNPYTGY
ncbi:MAG: hypothetical protein IPK79_12560 [Vampirovibrionales bacterium]|nr:hypothetical protein [Vampirovibrionales bacterium]